jgi:hypothetical protein
VIACKSVAFGAFSTGHDSAHAKLDIGRAEHSSALGGFGAVHFLSGRKRLMVDLQQFDFLSAWSGSGSEPFSAPSSRFLRAALQAGRYWRPWLSQVYRQSPRQECRLLEPGARESPRAGTRTYIRSARPVQVALRIPQREFVHSNQNIGMGNQR